MEFINDAHKRSLFMGMMAEFEEYDDLKADLEGDKCYDYIDSVKRMWIKIELPTHFDEGFMSMVAYKDWKDKIVITYFLTYGEKEYEFENYYEMIGVEKCDECGAYDWEECKSDCEYQARREREEEQEEEWKVTDKIFMLSSIMNQLKEIGNNDKCEYWVCEDDGKANNGITSMGDFIDSLEKKD